MRRALSGGPENVMPKARKRKPARSHGPAPTASRKRQKQPIGDKFPPKPDLGHLESLSFEEIMHKAMNTSGPVMDSHTQTEWRCITCGRLVWYPEVYYRDNRCQQCHQEAKTQ